jgi:hypothetical protein
LLTVTPELLTATVAPDRKLEPVSVTGILAPSAPLAGLIELIAGPGGVMVKVVAALMPPGVATVTAAGPSGVVAAIVRVAVICVALTTFTLLTTREELLTFTLGPSTKLVPVRVIVTAAFWAPLEGLTDVSVGAGGTTENDAAAVVPPAVVTVTFAVPNAAVADTVNVAVICVALTTVELLTATPGLLIFSVAPA